MTSLGITLAKMRFAAVGASMGLLGACSSYATPLPSLEPPAQYDYEPKVRYTLKYEDQDIVNQLCAGDLNKYKEAYTSVRAVGCTLIPQNIIYIVDGLPKELHDLVVRHEKAHINGWRHS